MAGGQERVLRRRIRSIQSTQKITRAQELIAASRIVRAQGRVHAAQPYSNAITEVVADLASGGGISSALLVPRDHYETLGDLPDELVGPLFESARLLSVAIPKAMLKPGSFVALNNVVSQSVPHLHVHVVPRKPKDGLRGFFWPRSRYSDPEEAESLAARLRAALDG